MSKVTFRRGDKRVPHQRYGLFHSHDYAICDLALPTDMLGIIAHVMSCAPWLDECFVHDAEIHAKLDHRAPYVLQERALHRLLGIARRIVDEMLAEMKGKEPETVPEAIRQERSSPYHSGPRASLAHGGQMVMPVGCWKSGFALDHTDEGVFGYFVTTMSHDVKDRKGLATKLLRHLVPEARIGERRAMNYGEILIGNPVRGLRDRAAQCLRAAEAFETLMKRELEALEWGGAPSGFTTEDDDARDALLDRVAAGLRIGRLVRPDAGYNDVDGNFEYETEDGETLDPHIVERLVNARLLVPEDGFWGRSPVLEAAEGITPRQLRPREHTVSFKAFESYCAHRRHDSGRECANDCNRSDYCLESVCPLVTQVHRNERDRYAVRFDGDPAFEPEDDWNHDPMVYAIHRNTERSGAWKAAGEEGVRALVDTVLTAKLRYGASHLVEDSLRRHALAAVEAGHLRLVDTLDGMGLVLEPTEALLERVGRLREASLAHAA